MHGLNLIRGGPTVGQKWLEGGRNRDEQGEDVAQGDMVGSLDGVGAVLAPAGVAYADLLLVVKPGLVELGPARCRESSARTDAARRPDTPGQVGRQGP